MTSPLLTAIVPITNMHGRMHNLDNWIQNLKSSPIEVVIVHDLVDLDTSLEIKELITRYPRADIKLIEGHYGSPGMARNAGFKIAQSNWICFWDSDDIPEIELVAQFILTADLVNIDFAIGGFKKKFDLDSSKEEVHLVGDQISNLLAYNPGIWRFLFKKTSIDDLKFTEYKMAEDQIFLAEYGMFSREHAVINHSIYNYYIGDIGHATNQKFALADLYPASIYTIKIANKFKDMNFNFIILLFIKQSFTSLKKCTFTIKLKSLLLIIRVIFKSGFYTKYRILLTICAVLTKQAFNPFSLKV